MRRSLVCSGLVDLALGIFALGVCALSSAVQPRSQVAFEYLLLGAPALVFPLATALRARTSRAPRWATLILVNASLSLGAVLLAQAAGASVTTLLPVVVVALAGGAAASLTLAGGWRWVGGAAPLASVAASLALVPWTMSSMLLRPELQERAPNVALRMVDGPEVQLASLAGRVVVLNFWSVHCVPCVRELPELESVARAYRGDPGMFFAAVEVGQDENAEAVHAFAIQHGIKMPVAYDPDEKVQRALGVLGTTPATIVIDPSGTIRHRRFGYAATADYPGWLIRVVEELAPRLNIRQGI
jgi:peroxiredoxin